MLLKIIYEVSRGRSCQKTIYQISEGVQYDILVKKIRSRVCIAALDVGQTIKIEKKLEIRI